MTGHLHYTAFDHGPHEVFNQHLNQTERQGRRGSPTIMFCWLMAGGWIKVTLSTIALLVKSQPITSDFFIQADHFWGALCKTNHHESSSFIPTISPITVPRHLCNIPLP